MNFGNIYLFITSHNVNKKVSPLQVISQSKIYI